MKAAGVLLAAVCSSTAAQVQAPDAYKFFEDDKTWQLYADARLWEVSDFMPTHKLEGDWSSDFSPRRGENLSLRRNRVEFGAKRGPWLLSLEARQEASLAASDQSLAFVRAYKLAQRPSGPVAYQLQARLDSWAAGGVRAGRIFDFGPARDVQLLVSAAWYAKPHYRQTQAVGSVSYQSSDQYAFQVSETDVNSRYQYLYRQYEPSAQGYSVSTALQWRVSDAVTLNYQVDDLVNRLRWQHLPQLRQAIDSQTVSYDSAGYINYQPVLQGRNSQSDTTVSIHNTQLLSAAYTWADWRATAQWMRFAGVSLPSLSLAKEMAGGSVSGSVDMRFHSLGLGWESHGFSVQLQSDTFRFAHAKVLGLGLRYLHAF